MPSWKTIRQSTFFWFSLVAMAALWIAVDTVGEARLLELLDKLSAVDPKAALVLVLAVFFGGIALAFYYPDGLFDGEGIETERVDPNRLLDYESDLAREPRSFPNLEDLRAFVGRFLLW